jgi:5'-deoxynucleotidase YfbR-like HD superfamily hydrolase
MDLKETTNEFWPGIPEILQESQTIFKGIYRWRVYGNSVRKQNDLQHSFSITILASIFMAKISLYNRPIDQALVLNAFLIHDYGEGLLGRDICLTDKVKNDDLDEYLAFVNRYSALDKTVFNQFHRAYLLQYAIDKEKPDFPPIAQEIIASLRASQMIEVLIFRAVETWEYILYALEQHQNGHKTILAEVMGNAKQRISFLTDNLPGFKEVIWTKEIAMAFQNL